jgi:hypothetical protein
MTTARLAGAILGGLLAAAGLAGPVRADDGDDTLRHYLSKSDVVVLGEFTSEPIGLSHEAGLVNYQADFKIARLLKGKPLGDRRAGGTIKANVARVEFGPADKLPALKKGGNCILFLKCNDRQEPPSYITADLWFGVQPPLPSLARALARLAAPPAKQPARGAGKAADGWQLSALPERQKVPAGEPVVVTLTLKNVGKGSLVYGEASPQDDYARMVTVTDEIGAATVPKTRYGKSFQGAPVKRFVTRTLRPGQEVTAKLYVSRVFDMTVGGTYRITVQHPFAFKPGEALAYAEVVSNTVEVTITEPAGEKPAAPAGGGPKGKEPPDTERLALLKPEMTFDEIRELWKGKKSLGQTCGEGVNQLTKETGGAYGEVYPWGPADAEKPRTLKVWYFQGKDPPFEVRGPGYHYYRKGEKYVAVDGPPKPEPAGGRKPDPAAADPVRGKYVAYWLTRDPPDPDGAEYGPAVLLTRVPLPELADYDPLFRAAAKRQGEDRPPLLDGIALTFETYQKDSVWNPDGRPLKLPRSVGPVRAAAREVTVNGTKYRYDDCPIPDVVRLLERPEGKKPLNRIHGPLTGAENTARALMLLLKEQLAAEQKNPPAPPKPEPPVDLSRFPTLRGKVTAVVGGSFNSYTPPVVGQEFVLPLKDLPKQTGLTFTPPKDPGAKGAARNGLVMLYGPPTVETVNYYTNGEFASMRLVSRSDPKRGRGSVVIDISPAPGAGRGPNGVRVWVVAQREDVVTGVVLVEGVFDGTFPDRPK